jgi:hypothetical protein
MLFHRALSLFVLGTQAGVWAQEYHPQAIESLPSCGVSGPFLLLHVVFSSGDILQLTLHGISQLKCLIGAVSESTCALTDTACICQSAALNAEITTCVTQTCTIIDSLSESLSID